MGKKVEHEIYVDIEDDNRLSGHLVIHHGSIKVGNTQLGTDLTWKCDVNGEEFNTLMVEAARNISVRMAAIRDLPEAMEKVQQLRGSTVKYADIASWTTKGSKGRKKIEDMSIDEILAKLTPEQLKALAAKKFAIPSE